MAPPNVTQIDGWQLLTKREKGAGGTKPGQPTADAKPGWQSLRRGARLAFSAEEEGELTVSLFLLHSYSSTGTLRVTCERACACPPLEYSTRWTLPYSGDRKLAIQTKATRPGCTLILTASSDEFVKLRQIVISVAD